MKILQEKYLQEVHGQENNSAKLLAQITYNSIANLNVTDLSYALKKVIDGINEVAPNEKEALHFFIEVMSYIKLLAEGDNNNALLQRISDLTNTIKHGAGNIGKIGLNEEESIDPEDEVAIIKSVFYKDGQKPSNTRRKI